MFENKFNHQVTVKIPSGTYIDGKPQTAEYPLMSFRTEVSQFDLNLFGQVKLSRVYLVDTTMDIPVDSLIVDGEDTITVTASRPCRKVSGEIVCMRVGTD
jgi:hypothetical protein